VPSIYTEQVSARIEAAVQKKVEVQEITLTDAPEGGAQVIDLMDALRASLEKKAPMAAAKASQPLAEARKPAKRAQEAEAEPAVAAPRKRAKSKG